MFYEFRCFEFYVQGEPYIRISESRSYITAHCSTTTAIDVFHQQESWHKRSTTEHKEMLEQIDLHDVWI